MVKMMERPFRWIEMQTTGVLLDRNYLRFLRNHVGVNTISISISSFDDAMNNGIIHTPSTGFIKLKELCAAIKEYDFTLRLSLNLTNEFLRYDTMPQNLFKLCREEFGADQVTLRVLYTSGTGTPQDEWIKANGMPERSALMLEAYVRNNGKPLGVLPHGAVKYSIDGLCVVVDNDCMDKADKTKKADESYKYLILQPNCKLYSQWDDPASLIF